MQSYIGVEKDFISEYPVELKSLAQEISKDKIIPNNDGYIHVPERPGLGITVDTQVLKKYLVDVEIKVGNKQIYYTPEI